MELEPTLTVDERGSRWWYLNDQYHRTDGPAVEFADGTRIWCLYGLRHRTDGPAVESANGDRQWYLNGQRHRTDGPAVELADRRCWWFLNGQNYTFREWLALTNVDERTRLSLLLKYSS